VTQVTKGGSGVGSFSVRVTLVTFVTLISAAAFAADKPFAAPQTPEHPAASTAGSLLQVTLSLALVLAAVFAAAWVVRRLSGFGRFGANAIQVVADAPLGTKERAVLVQVGEQQLLLGVTQSQVNLLHVLPQPISIAPPPAPGGEQGNRPDFAAILKRSLGLK
jgi:flagellar protein FliO/FliZ